MPTGKPLIGVMNAASLLPPPFFLYLNNLVFVFHLVFFLYTCMVSLLLHSLRSLFIYHLISEPFNSDYFTELIATPLLPALQLDFSL